MISTNVSSSDSASSINDLINKEVLNRIPKHPGSPPYDMAKQLITHDEVVGHDYQGWPLYSLRVISLLRAMGMSEDIITQIPEDILKMEILSSEDEKQSPNGELHGMGYGINKECIVNCAIDKNKNIVYLWRMPLTNVNNVN